MAGKTGADAIFKSIHAICGTIRRYSVKLDALISAAVIAGVITSGEATTARTFVSTANLACDIFNKLAGFNSIQP